MPAGSLALLRRRHAEEAREDPDAETFGSSVLYGLGGILLGASAFALLVLLEDNDLLGAASAIDVAPWLLLAWGAMCVAAGLSFDLAARKPRLGDAFHVAALLAITSASFPRPEELPWFGVVAMAFAAGMLVYRRQRFLTAFLALAAFNGAYMWFLFEGLEGILWGTGDGAVTLWFAYAVLQVLGLAAASRWTKWPWPSFSLAMATLLMAGSFLAFYFEVAEDPLPHFQAAPQVYLAILMAPALVGGLALREKGLVLAAAFTLAIDSIAFAFDLGEIVGGLLALLTVAGLLIWQAGNLRRYLREG